MSELAEHFRHESLAWLVERLVRRAESGKSLVSGILTLADADPAQRRAMDDLLGRRSTDGAALSVNLAQLASKLGLDEAAMLVLLGEVRGREVENLRARREGAAKSWSAIFEKWERHFAEDEVARVWLGALRGEGLLKRFAGGDLKMAEELLGRARRIFSGMPYPGVLLATIAAQSTGDSHALDRGKPLATLCFRYLCLRYGISSHSNAAARRDAWLAAGVTVDDLSAPVLCLNLPTLAGSALAPWIGWHVERGEPFYLPWRQLAHFEADPAMGEVFVCENPAVVSEAAARLGPDSRPLICMNGQPTLAVRALLRKLVDAGMTLQARADFDWAGLRILSTLGEAVEFMPWRMGVEDYFGGSGTRQLTGRPHQPSWAGELVEAMAERQIAVHEEDLIENLIKDLSW